MYLFINKWECSLYNNFACEKLPIVKSELHIWGIVKSELHIRGVKTTYSWSQNYIFGLIMATLWKNLWKTLPDVVYIFVWTARLCVLQLVFIARKLKYVVLTSRFMNFD
jgi:hypothetical protein